MQVELTGCTGAGKTTLANRIVKRGRERDIAVSLGTDFVLRQIKSGWVKSKLARTLLIDLAALIACSATLPRNIGSYRLAIKVILRLPQTVSRFEKLNLIRNAIKKIGIYEIICRFSNDEEIVLVDEGTLHAAHNLFVHALAEPDTKEFPNFVKQVPLPDVAIYVTQKKSILIERTIKRGHSRIPESSPELAERFIECAVGTFDRLMNQLVFEKKLQIYENGGNKIYHRATQCHTNLATIQELIAAKTDVAQPEKSGGQSNMGAKESGAMKSALFRQVR